MQRETILVMTTTFFAVFAAFAAIAALVYDAKKRAEKLTKEERDPDDWLFKGWEELVYDALYGKSTSDKICGIDRAEYARYCEILKRPNDFKKIVAWRAVGVGIATICLALSAVMGGYDLMVSLFFGGIAAAAFAALWILPWNDLKNKVEERLFRVHNDLPRFLSLLEKAMDLPIDQAMMVTARKFDSPLSEDLIDSVNRVSLGANGWQETLIDLAKVYQIEDFSDLVLEIVNSYEQGVNIRPLVNRKAYEVEQNRMYAVEAHDSKIKTMIYVPIIGFKVLPLMALICLPMLGDIM